MDDLEVLAPSELATHHAVILKRFCMQQDVSGVWIRKPSEFRFLARDWDVLGGGHFEIDEGKRSLSLFGESTSFEGYDRDGLKGKPAALPAFRGYAIGIALRPASPANGSGGGSPDQIFLRVFFSHLGHCLSRPLPQTEQMNPQSSQNPAPGHDVSRSSPQSLHF